MNQESGWNQEIIEWCAKEAPRQELKKHEYWGGLIMDEMKIQVKILLFHYFEHDRVL